MTRLEQVGRSRHLLALRERLRHSHENTVQPNDFTKTEKVCSSPSCLHSTNLLLSHIVLFFTSSFHRFLRLNNCFGFIIGLTFLQEVSNMAAKAAGECAGAGNGARDETLYEPWEMTARERELGSKFLKLIQGMY